MIRRCDPVRFIPSSQGWFSIWKSTYMIYHKKERRDQNHTIISIDAEKAFDKIKPTFVIKKKLMKVVQREHVTHRCGHNGFSRVWLFEIPRTVAHQAPLSMGFSRQEYRSGLPFPPPGNLPKPGIELESPALAGGFFTISTTWEALREYI